MESIDRYCIVYQIRNAINLETKFVLPKMHILIVFCSVHTNENTSSGLGFCKEFFLWLTDAQLPIRAQVCNSPPLYKIPGSVPVVGAVAAGAEERKVRVYHVVQP